MRAQSLGAGKYETSIGVVTDQTDVTKVLSGQLEYIEKFRSGAGRGWFLMNFWGLLLVFQPLAGIQAMIQ